MTIARQEGSSSGEVISGPTVAQEPKTAATTLQVIERPEGSENSMPWEAISSISAMVAAVVALVSVLQLRKVTSSARVDMAASRSSDLYKQHVLDPLTVELRRFVDVADAIFADARKESDDLGEGSPIADLEDVQERASRDFSRELSNAWRRVVLHLDSWDPQSLTPTVRKLWEHMDDSVCGEFDKTHLPTDEMVRHVQSGVTAILREAIHFDPAGMIAS